ncbi:MAG: RcnB family protein [Sphingomicrobium sp.]
MRKFLIPLLLASAAATPALADPGDHHDRDNARAEHQQARVERQESRSSGERPQFNGRGNFTGMNNGAQPQNFQRGPRFQQNVQVEQAQTQDARDDRQRFRDRRQFQGQGQVVDESLRRSDRPIPNVMQVRNRTPMVNEVNGRDRRIAWNRDWRSDRRYDWHEYRERHRSRFHLGIYYDPFGYGYQPFGIGFQLSPAYYGQNYWFDPGLYGLPYPPPGTEWVRYWNDALLVDVYTGQVVDVIRNFFW